MSKYTVLLIDYEPRSIESLRRPLEAAGYRVEVANDGIQGVKAFETLKPDLTLIEAMIPKKHGFEVCQELKKSEHGRDRPVVILTAVYKGRKYRSQAVHLYKCDEYLEKPIPEDLLMSTVRRLLRDECETVVERIDVDASPPAARAPAREAGAGLSAELGGATEAEIMERLDAILSGDAEAAAVPAPPETSEGDSEVADEQLDAMFARLIRSDAADGGAESPLPEADEPTGGTPDEAGGLAAALEGLATDPIADAADDEPDPAGEGDAAADLVAAAEELRDEAGDPLEGDEAGMFEDAGTAAGELWESEPSAPPDAGEAEPSEDTERTPDSEDARPLAGTARAAESEEARPAAETEQDAESEEAQPAAEIEHAAESEDAQPAEETEQAAESEHVEGQEPTREGSQVVSFDAERRKRRRDRRSEGRRGAAAPAVAAAEPAALEEEPRPAERAEPVAQPAAEVAAEPVAATDARSSPDAGRPTPPWIWIGGAAAVLVVAVAVFLMTGSGEEANPEGIAAQPPASGDLGPEIAMTDPAATPFEATGDAASEPTPPATDAATGAAVTEPSPREPRQETTARQPEPRPERGSNVARREPERPTSPPPRSAPAAREPAPVETAAKRAPEPKRATPAARSEPRSEPAAQATPPPREPVETAPAAGATIRQPAEEKAEPAPFEPRPIEAEPTTLAVQRTQPAPAVEPEPPAPSVRRGDLMELAAVDEQPRSVRRELPAYTHRAMRLKQQGTVELRVLVDHRGKVADVEIVRPIPNSDLNDAAVEAVRRWTYTPARKDGVPVKVWKTEKVHFRL